MPAEVLALDPGWVQAVANLLARELPLDSCEQEDSRWVLGGHWLGRVFEPYRGRLTGYTSMP